MNFQDPAFSLISVHHDVCGFIIFILSFVCWCLIKLICEFRLKATKEISLTRILYSHFFFIKIHTFCIYIWLRIFSFFFNFWFIFISFFVTNYNKRISHSFKKLCEFLIGIELFSGICNPKWILNWDKNYIEKLLIDRYVTMWLYSYSCNAAYFYDMPFKFTVIPKFKDEFSLLFIWPFNTCCVHSTNLSLIGLIGSFLGVFLNFVLTGSVLAESVTFDNEVLSELKTLDQQLDIMQRQFNLPNRGGFFLIYDHLWHLMYKSKINFLRHDINAILENRQVCRNNINILFRPDLLKLHHQVWFNSFLENSSSDDSSSDESSSDNNYLLENYINNNNINIRNEIFNIKNHIVNDNMVNDIIKVNDNIIHVINNMVFNINNNMVNDIIKVNDGKSVLIVTPVKSWSLAPTSETPLLLEHDITYYITYVTKFPELDLTSIAIKIVSIGEGVYSERDMLIYKKFPLILTKPWDYVGFPVKKWFFFYFQPAVLPIQMPDEQTMNNILLSLDSSDRASLFAAVKEFDKKHK